MKILNPTVFLRDDELFCFTVEVPEEPDEVDGAGDFEPQWEAYEKRLKSAKSSAVKVKNKDEVYASYFVYNSPDRERLYTLTGYEAEVAEEPEYPIDHTSYPPYIKFATITPITKEESQEEIWSELIGFLNVPLSGPVNYERMLSHLNKHFTISRKP